LSNVVLITPIILEVWKHEATTNSEGFVKSESQLADVLTKAVSAKVFQGVIDKLGMIDIYAPT